MKIQDAVVLVTGANRGIGLAFAKEALARGARKVYAAARNPQTVPLPGVIPVALDVTNADQAEALMKDLASKLKPRNQEHRETIRLWNNYVSMALVMVLLCTEWVLRKRHGLP